MLIFLVIFCVLIALGFGLASGWSDFRGMVISNVYPAGVILAFIPAFAAVMLLMPESSYFYSWKSHMLAFAVMFAVTFGLYSANLIGAGDSKLSAAFALWVGLQGMPAFLFYMAICGGLLGLTALSLRKWKPVQAPPAGSWVARAQEGSSAVPYGIAIAVGAVIAFFMNGYFNLENLAALTGAATDASGL